MCVFVCVDVKGNITPHAALCLWKVDTVSTSRQEAEPRPHNRPQKTPQHQVAGQDPGYWGPCSSRPIQHPYHHDTVSGTMGRSRSSRARPLAAEKTLVRWATRRWALTRRAKGAFLRQSEDLRESVCHQPQHMGTRCSGPCWVALLPLERTVLSGDPPCIKDRAEWRSSLYKGAATCEANRTATHGRIVPV